ncbi:cytochrome P450 [Phenylobacterium sp.]|uniref:cytochrome P450 n=1 Tax=Phenylobacterium sp. TaxID=1871053 RepID=UPI003BABD259
MSEQKAPEPQDLPTGFQLLEIDPEFRTDPYPRLADLQARCPVRHDPVLESVVVTGYENVRGIVNDRSLWRNPARGNPRALFSRVSEGSGDRPLSILFMDDPDHARVRGPLTQAFYKRAAKMKPQTETIVDEVLDSLSGRAAFDIIADYGVPVPILVIAAVLGIEKERLREFREWSEGIILSLNALRTPEQDQQLMVAAQALDAFFAEAMAERRARPRDDLITDMVQLQAAGAQLSDEEVSVNLQSLLVGGNLTTTDLIGNGVRAFLTHPEQLAALKADPKLIAMAVEEILRWDPPITMTSRIASCPMEVGGEAVSEKEAMITVLRAANRDPAIYESPERFDITRKHVPHMAFGGGAHICIGAPLARMEGQVALWKLFERFPNLKLADQTLTYRALPGFRGLESLIVEP